MLVCLKDALESHSQVIDDRKVSDYVFVCLITDKEKSCTETARVQTAEEGTGRGGLYEEGARKDSEILLVTWAWIEQNTWPVV